MRLHRAAFALSFALATFATPLAAQAQPPSKEVAKKLFEEGVELEKQAEYGAALGKYKEAEQITVTPGLRFHKGYCLEMSGRLLAAVDEYQAADKLARDGNKPEVRAAVAARLEPLRARIPQLLIRVTAESKDPDIQLDGAPLTAGQVEGKPFKVDPGDHEVRARAPSTAFKNFVKKVRVPEGITFTVDIFFEHTDAAAPPVAVVPPSSGAAAAVTEPPTEAPPKRSYALPIATTVGTLALAGGGIAFFLVSASAQSDAQTSCVTKPSCDDERSRVRTLDAFALGSFIGAAGLGVLSAVLWTSGGGRGGERSASLVTKSTAGGASLGLQGSF